MSRTPPGQTRERVYRYVCERLAAGLPPTMREVQSAIGFKSVQSAREHMEKLVEEGRLAKHEGKSRGYYLPGQGAGQRSTTLVPLLGSVRAGNLTEAIEDHSGYVPMQPRRAGEYFALLVEGDSMIKAGIMEGDLVLVRKQERAVTGDVVVALVNDEATVKTLKLRGQRIELHPANTRYKPIVPDPDTCRILGKVVEVRRHLEAPKRTKRR